MPELPPVPEVSAATALHALLEVEFADEIAAEDHTAVTVSDGAPPPDSRPRVVWVAGISGTQEIEAMFGEAGPPLQKTFTVSVICEVADAGSPAATVRAAVWSLVARVNAMVAAAVAARHDFGETVRRSPRVIRTDNNGPLGMKGGGFVDTVAVDIQFETLT